MKKVIVMLIAAVMSLLSVCSAAVRNTADAYLDNNKLIIECDSISSVSVKNVPELLLFFDAEGALQGVTRLEKQGDCYYSELIEDYAKVKIWIARKESESKFYTLNIIEKPVFTAEPAQSPSPSPVPTEEPQPNIEDITLLPEEEEEYSYHGVFYEQEKSIKQCGISISCLSAIEYEDIDKELLKLLPEDGIMLKNTDIKITDGMTVYDVLAEVAGVNGITLDGDSSYIEGINGLSEFSCGPLSGWVYSVNGEFPSDAIDRYTVCENDKVEIIYTCNLGEDVK